MKRFLFLTLCFSFLANISFAQITITGKVISKKDGNPISGAQIGVKDMPNIAVLTNTEGYYIIMVPETAQSLEAYASGYKSQTVGIGQKSVIVFELMPDMNPNKLNKGKYKNLKTIKKSNILK